MRLLKTEQIQTKARLPGEVSGSGLAFTVEVANNSANPVNLGNVVVTMTDSAGAPATVMTGPPAKPLRGSLEEAKAETGVYVFTVPASSRRPVTVFVSLGAGTPVVTFKGSIA